MKLLQLAWLIWLAAILLLFSGLFSGLAIALLAAGFLVSAAVVINGFAGLGRGARPL